MLASAWAKEPSVQRLAVNHCLVRLESKQKINRSCLFAFCCSSMLQHIPWTGYSHMSRCNHFCWLLVSGVLKENAEQIGHAVRHAGLRPALPMMQQAVDTFFHLCLPRRHEVCGHISASSLVHMDFGSVLSAGFLCVCVCACVWPFLAYIAIDQVFG